MDASAWYPLAVPAHRDHAALAALLQGIVADGARVVTTNLVIAETHALLVRRVNRAPALAFVRAVREPPNLVVASTPELEDSAISDWLAINHDHDFSLVDAVSFAVMTERKIVEALTLDRHFAAAGFRMLPGSAA